MLIITSTPRPVAITDSIGSSFSLYRRVRPSLLRLLDWASQSEDLCLQRFRKFSPIISWNVIYFWSYHLPEPISAFSFFSKCAWLGFLFPDRVSELLFYFLKSILSFSIFVVSYFFIFVTLSEFLSHQFDFTYFLTVLRWHFYFFVILYTWVFLLRCAGTSI